MLLCPGDSLGSWPPLLGDRSHLSPVPSNVAQAGGQTAGPLMEEPPRGRLPGREENRSPRQGGGGRRPGQRPPRARGGAPQ